MRTSGGICSVAILLFSLYPGESFQPHQARSATRSSLLPTSLQFSESSKHSSAPTSHARFHAIANNVFGTSALKSSVTGSDGGYDDECDVLVLGSGPAARSIASLLSAQALSVTVADQAFDRPFAPNFGVWEDEWESVCKAYSGMGVDLTGGSVGNSIDRKWDVTDCYFGGSFDIPTEQRMRLDRPYLRVDRHALRKTLTKEDSYNVMYANHISEAIGVNLYEPAGSLVHDSTGSTIQLVTKEKKKLTVRSKLIVDCTGHETKLVLRDTREHYTHPGFQIAYGCLVDVDDGPSSSSIGPYDKESMTLFDYRTDHYDMLDQGTQTKVSSAPTFMYAMPLKDNQVFFEETSLVARPALSFQECKDRCFRRLEHLGIKVTKLYEEEFCYIPMGGALPAKDQRILALGGSAAMVHPSTGYHLCRCMMGATDMAQAVVKELRGEGNLDRAAASAYHSLWTPDNIRQRNFAVFGGEFLMKQDAVGLRGFFDGFFRLPLELWSGFLAGWPGLPNNDQHETWFARMWFGLNFVLKLPFPVAADMAANIVGYIITGGIPLAQSVTPFLGEPPSYEYKFNRDNIGDVAAKVEARRMIMESKIEEIVPVAFDEGNYGEGSVSPLQLVQEETISSFQ